MTQEEEKEWRVVSLACGAAVVLAILIAVLL